MILGPETQDLTGRARDRGGAQARAGILLRRRRRSPLSPGRHWAPRCRTSGRTNAIINEMLRPTRRRRCQRARGAISPWARRAACRTAPFAASAARGAAAQTRDCNARHPPTESALAPPRPIVSSASRTRRPARAASHFQTARCLRDGPGCAQTAVAPASPRPKTCQCRRRFLLAQDDAVHAAPPPSIARGDAPRRARSASTQTQGAERRRRAVRLPKPQVPFQKKLAATQLQTNRETRARAVAVPYHARCALQRRELSRGSARAARRGANSNYGQRAEPSTPVA